MEATPDLEVLSSSQLRDLSTAAAAQLRANDRDVIATLETMDDAALTATLARAEDESDCSRSWQPDGHLRDECVACQARREVDARHYRRRAQEPGANSAISIPGVQTVSSYFDEARDIVPGDVATGMPVIGTTARVHYEAQAITPLDVSDGPERVRITWRKTNSDDPAFDVDYDADEHVTRLRVTSVRAR